MMKTVRDIPILKGIPILVRATLNVPVEKGKVVDTFRLRRALPTIEFLRAKKARSILISHITGTGTETFEPMWEAMRQWIPDLSFCPVSTGPAARAAARALSPGGVLMLENLRRDRGEETNRREFAAELASLADVFVEDSFDACHREHASIVSVPKLLPSYAGLLVEEEVRELSRALKPASPSLAIVGGSKFETKKAVLSKLLTIYDHVFVGGAVGNDFLAAAGNPVGKSLVSGADPKTVHGLLESERLLTPVDVVVSSVRGRRTTRSDDVRSDEAILDNGPETVSLLQNFIGKAKTILWNGPIGNYEDGYAEGTEEIARAIAGSTAYSIVGGGDTVAAIETLGLNDRFSFMSTGGGAMLEFLAKWTLPGIRVLG